MPFIRYVLGTPRSINLRNIAWHGFLTLNYSIEVYPKLLLWIILSLGRDSSSSGVVEIVHRPFSTSTIERCVLIRQNLVLDKEVTPLDLNHDLYLSHSCQLFEQCQYGRSLLFLLIRVEAHVRNLFSKANPKFDPRARIDGYYFTLDMILEQNVSVGKESFDETHKNNVIMTDSAISLFYDCFVSLKGPRIRDRMSHGELRLTDVTKEVVEIVALLYKELVFGSEIQYYESYFHPISELERKINELSTRVEHLRDLEIPNDLIRSDEMGFIDVSTPQILVRPSQVLRDPNFAQISKFLRMLCQIIENCTEAILKYTEALNQRFEEYLERRLSQPRRKTLTNTLGIRLRVIQGVVCCVRIVQSFCQDMTVIKCHASERPKEIKEVLKIVENLKVQLSIDKNDWKSASEGLSQLFVLSNKIK